MLTKIKSMFHVAAGMLRSGLPPWPGAPPSPRREGLELLVRVLAALWWRRGR